MENAFLGQTQYVYTETNVALAARTQVFREELNIQVFIFEGDRGKGSLQVCPDPLLQIP